MCEGSGLASTSGMDVTIVHGSSRSHKGSVGKLGQIGAGEAVAGRALLGHGKDKNQSTETLISPTSTVTVMWPSVCDGLVGIGDKLELVDLAGTPPHSRTSLPYDPA
jgi:hypothetical protein